MFLRCLIQNDCLSFIADNIVDLLCSICSREKSCEFNIRISDEHGLPHAHVSGKDPNTTVGLDKKPMPNYPQLSADQMKIIWQYWEKISSDIKTYFPKQHG